PPLLLASLVDASRFRGTCYRAANWIYVGQTTGRGRMDREHKAHGQAIKNIYVYPLARDAKQRLCSGPTRQTNTKNISKPKREDSAKDVQISPIRDNATNRP